MTLVDRWNSFWFAPKAAATLGLCRALWFGLLFFDFLNDRFAPWAHVSRSFWDPIWLFETFRIPLLPEQALFLCGALWKISLAAACLGLLTRVSTLTAFVLGFYLLGMRHNWGKLSHDDASIVFILGLMALSRCGDAFSIDALLRRTRRAADAPALLAPTESGEYRWPIRAVWLVLALVFFNSAVAKLRKSGIDWALSENLSVLMVRMVYFNKPTTDLGLRLANLPYFGQFMGVSALIVELFFPLVLLHRVARWVLVPAAFMMQVGNKLLLGVDFTVFMFAYVFFVDWEWLLTRMGLLKPRGLTTLHEMTEAHPTASAPTAPETFAERRAGVQRVPPQPSRA